MADITAVAVVTVVALIAALSDTGTPINLLQS
jgi:hypothetical protein